MSEPTFDPVKHQYFVDGVKVPSVNEIIDATLEGEQAAKKGYGFYPEAATRGTYVHELIQLWIADNLDESSLDPELEPYFAAFKRCWTEQVMIAHHVEKRGYAPSFGFCGTRDLIGCAGYEPNGKRILCDWKTGQIRKRVEYQLGGYAMLGIDEGLPPLDELWAVQLKKDGSYRVKSYEPNAAIQKWAGLLSQYQVLKRAEGAGLAEQDQPRLDGGDGSEVQPEVSSDRVRAGTVA